MESKLLSQDHRCKVASLSVLYQIHFGESTQLLRASRKSATLNLLTVDSLSIRKKRFASSLLAVSLLLYGQFFSCIDAIRIIGGLIVFANCCFVSDVGLCLKNVQSKAYQALYFCTNVGYKAMEQDLSMFYSICCRPYM